MSDIEKSITPSPVPSVSKGDYSVVEADKALDFLRHQATTGTSVEIDEKVLLRKIDWMIVP
jgi:hypothetical protein